MDLSLPVYRGFEAHGCVGSVLHSACVRVADGHAFSLTVCDLTRFYCRPAPALLLLCWALIALPHPRVSVCVCVCVRARACT